MSQCTSGVFSGVLAAGMPAVHDRSLQRLTGELAVRSVLAAPRSGRIAVL